MLASTAVVRSFRPRMLCKFLGVWLMCGLLFLLYRQQLAVRKSPRTLRSSNSRRLEVTRRRLKSAVKEPTSFKHTRQRESQPQELSGAAAAPPEGRPTSMATFEARRQKVLAACWARQHSNRSGTGAGKGVPYPYKMMRVKSVAFCPLPKTGTTFWKWILSYMDRGLTGPLLSHKYGDIHAATKYMTRGRFSATDRAKSTTIVFVREPYARLLSAYVDKAFTPRWENWQKYARPAVLHSRPGASKTEQRCAHNVTFAEFVRLFIYTEGLADNSIIEHDEHLVPISRQCHFCGVHYNFIGRQENFAEDTLGILAQLNASADMLTPSDFKNEYNQYFMEELIKYTCLTAMELITKVHNCVGVEEVLRRVWKAVQIRGSLASDELFPLSAEDVKKLGDGQRLWKRFLHLATAAFNRSVDSGAGSSGSSRSNNEQAMLEAYSTVPLSDRRILRDVVFRDDFEFFGYEPNHPLVFPPADRFRLTNYRYFDVFDTFLRRRSA